MRKEEINIAIAELVIPDFDKKTLYVGAQGHILFASLKDETACYELPDYTVDLNFMHNAESTLTIEQHAEFREELAKIVGFNSELSYRGARAYVSSTAMQRAEAFLKIHGKWVES